MPCYPLKIKNEQKIPLKRQIHIISGYKLRFFERLNS